MAFVVPHGVTWSLPLYEIALMTQRRAVERGVDVKIAVITPESAPLVVFGPPRARPSSELLRGARDRGLPRLHSARVRREGNHPEPRGPRARPGGGGGTAGDGGSCDRGPARGEEGFIPIDDHARVKGIEDVYAAGDGTSFPIKQGGIATQQADAAAEDIAHRLGRGRGAVQAGPARQAPHRRRVGQPERRGRGRRRRGRASPDVLWWPPAQNQRPLPRATPLPRRRAR